jgi:inner membrane protein
VIIGIYINGNPYFNAYYAFLAFLLGGLSHIALDIFSGSGVQLLRPLSKRKFGKKIVIIMIVLWIITIIYYNDLINVFNSINFSTIFLR